MDYGMDYEINGYHYNHPAMLAVYASYCKCPTSC